MGRFNRSCTLLIVGISLCINYAVYAGDIVEVIPIGNLYKVTDVYGATYFISENKRFIIKGEMKDLWNGSSVNQKIVEDKLFWDRNNVQPDKISYKIGSGQKLLDVFISPDCIACNELLKAIYEPSNLSEYSFRIVMLAASKHGQRTNALVWCANDKKAALWQAYVEKVVPTSAAKKDEKCNQLPLRMANEAAVIFGIAELPVVIDQNSNAIVGVPDYLIVSR